MQHLLPALISLSLIFVAAPGLADSHIEVIGSCDVDLGVGQDGIHPGFYTGNVGEPVPAVGIGGCNVVYDTATEDDQVIEFAPADGCHADAGGPSDAGDGMARIWFFCDTGVSGTNEVHLVTPVAEE